MYISRLELKSNAKNALRGKWGLSIGVYVVFQLLASGVVFIPFAGAVAVIIFSPALAVGFIDFFLKLSRYEDAKFDSLFGAFSYFGKAFGLCFMVGLFTLLWSLLLFIPGIVASFRYSMALYILADNPDIGIMEAIDLSKKMTYGYKADIFVLGLSFLGWILLAMLTLGIGLLWLVPYMQTTFANMYNKLKTIYEAKNETQNFTTD